MQTIENLSGTKCAAIGKRNSVAVLRAAIESLEARTLLSSVVVNSVSDTAAGAGVVTLRDAIAVANTSTTPTTITFSPTVFATAKTITLSGTDLQISGKQLVTITGPAAGVTINGNQHSGDFQIDAGATASLSGMTLTGGSVSSSNFRQSGGIFNSGTATLTDCTVSGNTGVVGGGILNYYAALTLIGCTVSGNTATANGGGIGNEGAAAAATLTDCTISGNSASGGGGGIDTDETLTLADCTLTGNSSLYGGGIFNAGIPQPTLANSIVAGNTSPNGPDVNGAFNSLGFNLVGQTNDSAGWDFDDFTGTSAQPLNAKLGALANNGGPTQTVLPLAGSPAIDHGDNVLVPAGITTDQRGLPRVSNGTVDIGAVEVQETTPIVVTAPAAQTAMTAQSKLFALGSFTQSNATAPFNVDVHWGDGTADSKFSVAAAGTIPATAHTFGFSGKITVIVSVTDSAGHTSNSATFAVTVTGSSAVVVNSASDTASGPGVITLRDAIDIADRTTGPTTITFDPTVFASPQTITLSGSDLEISNSAASTTITGPSAGVTIDGALQVDPRATASVSHVNFTNPANGGIGVGNSGTIALNDCTISGDNDTGIDNAGTATLTGCTFSGNSGFGGIDNTGTATVMGCTISDNGNGGVKNAGVVTLTGCTIADNSNGSEPGGGVTNTATAILIDCTVTGNTTSGVGGGIANSGALALSDCTVSGNSAGTGGGIDNGSEAAVKFTLANSIIAGNTAPSDPDVHGAFNSLGFNLVGKSDGSTGWGFYDFTGTAAHPLDARLGALANNGGPTQTLLPLAGSPAIDLGDNALIPKGVTTDQRGLPRVSNGTVDIGAVEVQETTPISLTAPAGQTAMTGQSKLVALGSFTQSHATGPFHVDVHWGDGAPDSTFSVAAAGTLPPTAHTFGFSGNTTVIVVVTDSAGHRSNSANFVVSVSGGANTVVVNTASDTANGMVTLRDAIEIADSSKAPTTISFDPKVFATPQTIVVTGPILELSNTSEPTTITGPAGGVTIDGDQTSGDLQIDKGVTASLSGLTITGGVGTVVGSGGVDNSGVDNAGTLTLTSCTITANSAGSAASIMDAGLYNSGTATLNDCTVSGNKAAELFDDYGIHASGNGGIDNTGHLLITNSTIANNSGNFAGIENEAGAVMTLTNVTVSGNTGEGLAGIDNQGTATLTAVTIADNNAMGYPPPSVPGGETYGPFGTPGGVGGIKNTGRITLTDCTIANNNNGGIDNAGALTLDDSTVSGNADGPGLIVESSSKSTVIANSIIAGNFGGSSPDVFGSVQSSGYNLVGQTDGSTGWKSTDLTGTIAKPLDASLSPLGPFGGATQTMVPEKGSPAIDHGSNALVPPGTTTDQRGLPRIVNGTVDVGAVEVQPTSARITVTASTGLKAVEGESVSLSTGRFAVSGAAAPYLVQVNWGDGTAADVLKVSAPGSVPADKHTFTEAGTYHGTLAVVDAQGNTSSAVPFTVIVADAPLRGSVQSLSGVAAGVPFAWQVATFNDASPYSIDSDFSATINWGDGTTSTGVVASFGQLYASKTGPYGVTGTHAYAKAGTYTFTVTANDVGGSKLAVSSTVTCVNAKSIVVNTTKDQIDPAGSATVSLRDAVALADKSTTPFAITFDPKVFATAQTITLAGSDLELSSPTTISIVAPAAGVTISGNGKSAAFVVERNVNASFSGVTITDGITGISNSGVLFLTNSSVVGNTSSEGSDGGGISNQNYMVLTGDTISGNQTGNYGSGGGIENDGKMTLIQCTVADNTADNQGGGIHNGGEDDYGIGVLTLLDTTISGNTAGAGGGVFSYDLPSYVGPETTAANTIIAGNSAGNAPDVNGPVHSLGFNLVGQTDGSAGWTSTDLTGTSAEPLNPKLGALANNGGPTQTLLPLPASPALNHGSNALIAQGLNVDQRGKPRIVGGTVDIGAVEV